jgi:hypothetical protein
MVIPAAAFIEEAADVLKRLHATEADALLDQRKELHVANVGPDTEDFRQGYELGLQTARVILAQTPAAQLAGLGGVL